MLEKGMQVIKEAFEKYDTVVLSYAICVGRMTISVPTGINLSKTM